MGHPLAVCKAEEPMPLGGPPCVVFSSRNIWLLSTEKAGSWGVPSGSFAGAL